MSELERTPLRRVWRLALVGLLLALPQVGHTNARAPLEVPRHGSEAAVGTPAPGMVVLSETLDLSCGQEACRVTAAYAFVSESAAETTIRFVLPEREPLTVRVNENETNVAVSALAPTSPPSDFGDASSEPVQRWQVEFEASLAPGINRVVVRYEQPLGLVETRRGYFRSSEFANVFRYELWPLKEWTLSDTFSLRIALTMPRERSFWDQLTEPAPLTTCWGIARDRGPLRPLQLSRSLSETDDSYSAELDRRFPDTLECRIAGRTPTQRGRALFPDLTSIEARGRRARS